MNQLEQVLQSAQSLTVADKIFLAETLWDSIREKEMPILTEADKQEMDRRIASYHHQPETSVPWSKIQETARNLLK